VVTVSGIVDALGNPVPDGSQVAVTAQQIGVGFPDGHCCGGITSSGGTIINGTPAANDSRFNVLAVVGGQVQVVYSSLGVELGAEGSTGANVQLLPADAAGNRLGFRAFAVGGITLTGYQTADILGPGTLAPGATGTYSVQNILDTAGNPVPDGSKVAVTAQGIGVAFPDGHCCGGIPSAGGTITNGTVDPSDGRFQSFTVQGGTFSVDFQAPAQSNVTSVLQLLPARPNGSRIGFQAFALKSVAIGP
jgi:hypothetical protein